MLFYLMEVIQKLIHKSQLPSSIQRMDTRALIFQFLHEVTRHSEKNKMNSKNLAIVFAPNIMVVSSIAVPTKRSGKDSLASYSKDLFHNVEIVEVIRSSTEFEVLYFKKKN